MGAGTKPPIGNNPDLLKPLVFPNHQRGLKIFSYVVSAAVVYYGVFVYQWPTERHCFSWIRELKERKKRQFFHIDSSDPALIHIREQHSASEKDR
ncbi:hypothetical protein GBAR_LOCUS13390 [Geodia barretti]|uniref:Uncharacterized protein n=1 Tax=Geodia barretti TaxID=519541 RepID=A0AA35S641_GEOBA|nr:hypothetical protein GBAR_LOCUS13390 [Geodia barretti]